MDRGVERGDRRGHGPQIPLVGGGRGRGDRKYAAGKHGAGVRLLLGGRGCSAVRRNDQIPAGYSGRQACDGFDPDRCAGRNAPAEEEAVRGSPSLGEVLICKDYQKESCLFFSDGRYGGTLSSSPCV